jgi:hypothetical protein
MANSNVNFLQAASIVPFLQAMDIEFVADSLLPDREVFYFFDNEDVHAYVDAPNIIHLTNRTDYRDLTSSRRRVPVTTGSANSADVLYSAISRDTSKTMVYVANVEGKFVAGATLASSGQTSSTIDYYIHRSGRSWKAGIANTVYLANDASVMANNYWGTGGANTIFITSGTGIRQYGNIAGFNNATMALTLSNSLTTNTDDTSTYTIGRPTGGQITDDDGVVSGVFHVPSDSTLNFRTGERILKVTDSPRNIDDESETVALATFYGVGLQGVASPIGDPDEPRIVNRTTTTIVNRTTTTTVINSPVFNNNLMEMGGNDGNRDPLAQTFLVSRNQYPNGLFLTSIDLFFSSKDANSLPVTVEVRPVENGFPSSTKVYPNSRKSIKPDDVNLSTTPNVANASTATTFTFRSPVYIPPGEHAIVVLTQSRDYRLYISELGQTIIGSNKIVSEQPYVGSLFKSQNATTWTPFQMQDLMFRLRRADFVPSGDVVFTNRFKARKGDVAAAADLLFTRCKGVSLPNTSLDYTHSIDSGSSYSAMRPNRYFNPSNRFHITQGGNYKLAASLSTSDNAVSPIISLTQHNVIAIQKLINNGNITNAQISITSGGSGYTANANIALSFGDGAGNTNPAVGYALANSSGIIESVIITDGGTRFTNDMTVTPASGTATFNFVSEVDSRGGPCQAKYISRIVSLKEGFDGGDLFLYLTANKPNGTEIKCYYKIRNNQDPEPFDYKPYQEFVQITPSTKFSADEKERIEYEFRPSLTSDDITYTSDGVTYTTFHQFAFKIVLLSNNTTKNPVVYDARCIALPGS